MTMPVDWVMWIIVALMFPSSPISLEARELRSRAREIRRRWPNSEFAKRPANYWSGEPCSNEVIKWHDQLLALGHGVYAHEDFDQVMERLEGIEHESSLCKLLLFF